MIEYDELINESKERGLALQVEPMGASMLISGDVLFYTPLLSLSILVIASSVKTTFTASEVSSWTGSVLAQNFWGHKQVNKKLEWSLTLRKRCADAIIFLESMGLISVTGKNREIEITAIGKKFCTKALKKEDSFGQLVRGIRRATINTELKGFTLL